MTPTLEPSAEVTEPRWIPVQGGPLPLHAALREAAVALLVPLALLFWGLFAPLMLQLLLIVAALLLSAVLGLWARRRYFFRQRLRVLGNLLEHRDGSTTRRVALTRVVLSVAAGGPEALVLVLDDGQCQIAVGRKAESHELAGLPPRMGLWYEVSPEDFEEIRAAAHRPYARA